MCKYHLKEGVSFLLSKLLLYVDLYLQVGWDTHLRGKSDTITPLVYSIVQWMVPVIAEVVVGSRFNSAGFLSERFSLYIGPLLPSPVASLGCSSDIKQEIVSVYF